MADPTAQAGWHGRCAGGTRAVEISFEKPMKLKQSFLFIRGSKILSLKNGSVKSNVGDEDEVNGEDDGDGENIRHLQQPRP